MEQARHLGGRLEIALGIGGEAASRRVDRQVLADAGEHVLQFAPIGVMIEHIIDRNQRHAGLPRHYGAPGEPRTVIAAVEHGGGEPHAVVGGFAQQREELGGFFLRIGNEPDDWLRRLWILRRPALPRGGQGC